MKIDMYALGIITLFLIFGDGISNEITKLQKLLLLLKTLLFYCSWDETKYDL